MWELKNRKTGRVYLVSDDEYQSLKENGRLNKFISTKMEPIRKLVPIPGTLKSEITIKKTKAKK